MGRRLIGRTQAFGACYGGSSPPAPAKLLFFVDLLKKLLAKGHLLRNKLENPGGLEVVGGS